MCTYVKSGLESCHFVIMFGLANKNKSNPLLSLSADNNLRPLFLDVFATMNFKGQNEECYHSIIYET